METQEGVYTVRVPDFLDCTGPLFSPAWDAYHALLLQWDVLFRNFFKTGALPTHGEPRVIADQVQQMSIELLGEWMPALIQDHASGLHEVIRGHRTPESLGGQCYFGLVNCLWTRAQFLSISGLATPGLQLRDGVPVAQEAFYELQQAMTILGHDFRADYLESSRWPVRGTDIYMSLELQRLVVLDMMEAQVRAEALPALGQYAWNPRDDFFAMGDRGDLQSAAPMHIAAFGNHAALLSEPVIMLRAAFPATRIAVYWVVNSCRRSDPIHHYHCRLNCVLLGDCDFVKQSSKAVQLLQLVDYAAEGVGERSSFVGDPSLSGLLDYAHDVWVTDEFLRDAHLVVCTVPLICSLLRSVMPLPMLGYFAMWAFLDPATPGIGDWGMAHFAEMSKNSNQNAIAFSNDLLSELAGHQTGVKLPVVRPFGLYNAPFDVTKNPFAELHPHTGAARTTVVVPRSSLTIETDFLRALTVFVDAVEPMFPLNFTVLRTDIRHDADPAFSVNPSLSGERLGDLMKRDENVFVDAKRMLQYRAALFVPQAPGMMSFYEFHSVHLPMFIPGKEWLYRLYKQRRYAQQPHFASGRMGVYDRLMRPPLCNHFIWTASTNSTLYQWLILYERHFEIGLPGVRTFQNFPELIEQLLHADLDGIREEMRRYNEDTFQPVLRWYRAAVHHLFEAARVHF